ncbi:MAG: hypothetical protein ACOC7J_01710 [Armatimonadota bacterium]
MTDNRRLAVVATLITVAFILVALPVYAQVDDQPRIERPRVNTGPQIQVDPRVLQRPNLQLRPQNIEFRARFDERLMERASRMNLYRLEDSPVNAETMMRLAEQYTVTGQQQQFGTMLAVTDEDNGFMMLDRETGRLAFNVDLADMIDDNPGDLPSDREAGQIAMEFLRENQLMPDAQQAVVAHIGRIMSTSDQINRPMAQALVVHFARQVDDVRVVGPGSKAVVQLGDGGKIAGGGVEWRALGKPIELDARQLRGVADVQKDIQSTLAREFKMARGIVVDRVGLFYHDAGGYLQPVVGYQAQIQSGEFSYSYFGQVPLMQQPPVQVGPQQISPEILERLQKGPEDLKPQTEGEND